jgi:hypothetical protein
MGAGGLVITSIFAVGNDINRYIQDGLSPIKNNNYINNDPFLSAKSIVEEGDSLDNIMNFFTLIYL